MIRLFCSSQAWPHGDEHGYAIMADIRRSASLRMGPGTLYGAITRLEQQKWIRAVPPDDRRQPYTITSAGREFLKEQVEQLSRLVKTASKRLKEV
jgi:DNA-binding PadR family transcriptional regulator